MSEYIKYPAINHDFLTGDETMVNNQGQEVRTMKEYWSWAHSDLIGNTERGQLAEYIVACALGIEKNARVEWDRYDLLSAEGIAIEVKTSGYIQTWEQKELSTPQFGVQPTFGWNSKTNEYDTEKKRQSDVYVFCLHKHSDQGTINPLDMSQWDFYILPTKVLNEKVPFQKTISLNGIKKLGAKLCAYEQLHMSIIECI